MNIEWEKQNTKQVQQVVQKVKNYYPNISNIDQTGTYGSVYFSIYNYSDKKLIYTSDSNLKFNLSPLNIFIYAYEGNSEVAAENNELDWI